MLTVRDLSINLKGNKEYLTKNISFTLNEGKILGIIGESGSGKSLVCRAIMRLLDEDIFDVRGEVIFKDADIFGLSNSELNRIRGECIAMIMQNPMSAFSPTSKIKSQIVETLRAHKKVSGKDLLKDIEMKFMELGLYETKRILNSYSYELSGGMLQRIMIALTLLLSPKLIIADETTTALDIKTQALVLKELKKIKQSNVAIIVVTHNFGVLFELADDVLVMRNGEVIERGSVYQIFDNPLNKYTRELLAASNLKGG